MTKPTLYVRLLWTRFSRASCRLAFISKSFMCDCIDATISWTPGLHDPLVTLFSTVGLGDALVTLFWTSGLDEPLVTTFTGVASFSTSMGVTPSLSVASDWSTTWDIITVFDLISEQTLISGHPPPPPILCWWRLLPEHVEIYVYWLCYCVASCNRCLMLINHPTDGATHVAWRWGSAY